MWRNTPCLQGTDAVQLATVLSQQGIQLEKKIITMISYITLCTDIIELTVKVKGIEHFYNGRYFL